MHKIIGGLLFAASIGLGQVDRPEVAFRGGTRYVEVDVTVRHKRIRPPGTGELVKWVLDSGPPFGPPGLPFVGLTKDDFTLLDNGKRQTIAVFNTESRAEDTTIAVPPGAVSNRAGPGGEPLTNATVILVDLLNTPFGLTDYARLGLKNLLVSLGETTSRTAIYSLGGKLHVPHDLTDDPRQLQDVARLTLETGELPPDFAAALRDYGDVMGEPGGPVIAAREFHAQITIKALYNIIQHLSGLPGRKNLVWLSQSPPLHPSVVSLLERSNIVLYPVKVRGAGGKPGTPDSLGTFGKLASSGGRAFFDAKDLGFAVQTAQEDQHSRYVLGFYPPEDRLDGKLHTITVKIGKAQTDVDEIHYRTGYLATKAAPPLVEPGLAPSLLQVLQSPIEASGLGFAAQAERDPQAPGTFKVRVTVDLRSVRLEYRDGRFTGALQFAAPDPSSPTSAKTARIEINLSEERYVSALDTGFAFVMTGVEPKEREIHIAVRDQATSLSGSLRLSLGEI